jgi:hypothetical protein
VRLANAEEAFHRHDVDEREVRKPKDHNGRYHLWHPQRPTVVLLGTVAIGLTIVELSEHAHVRYMDGEYVRESPTIAKRALISRKHSWTSWKDVPTGRFGVIAYSPYPVAKWSSQSRTVPVQTGAPFAFFAVLAYLPRTAGLGLCSIFHAVFIA